MRHPLSPPSNSNIKPPYIPPPKKTMNVPKLWLPTIKRYDDGFACPSMTEAEHAGFVSYPDYLDIKARAEALDTEVQAMWKENHEIQKENRELRSLGVFTTGQVMVLIVVAMVIGYAIRATL